NSLNAEMVDIIYAQLQRFANDDAIKWVIIQAVPGRAFCAGGDLRQTYESYHVDRELTVQFFYREYRLNHLIYHYPKPYVALLDGITMGGGAGLSMNGRFRIGTENLLFAM